MKKDISTQGRVRKLTLDRELIRILALKDLTRVIGGETNTFVCGNKTGQVEGTCG